LWLQVFGRHLAGVESQFGWLSRIFCPMSERLAVTPGAVFRLVHLEIAAPMVAAEERSSRADVKAVDVRWESSSDEVEDGCCCLDIFAAMRWKTRNAYKDLDVSGKKRRVLYIWQA
jgi:hypothetical protein